MLKTLRLTYEAYKAIVEARKPIRQEYRFDEHNYKRILELDALLWSKQDDMFWSRMLTRDFMIYTRARTSWAVPLNRIG